jgi:hypothetical protein
MQGQVDHIHYPTRVTADKREIPGRRRQLGKDFRRVRHEGRVHNLDRCAGLGVGLGHCARRSAGSAPKQEIGLASRCGPLARHRTVSVPQWFDRRHEDSESLALIDSIF